LVAEALSTDTIMGLDFLESQLCVINTGQSVNGKAKFVLLIHAHVLSGGINWLHLVV